MEPQPSFYVNIQFVGLKPEEEQVNVSLSLDEERTMGRHDFHRDVRISRHHFQISPKKEDDQYCLLLVPLGKNEIYLERNQHQSTPLAKNTQHYIRDKDILSLCANLEPKFMVRISTSAEPIYKKSTPNTQDEDQTPLKKQIHDTISTQIITTPQIKVSENHKRKSSPKNETEEQEKKMTSL